MRPFSENLSEALTSHLSAKLHAFRLEESQLGDKTSQLPYFFAEEFESRLERVIRERFVPHFMSSGVGANLSGQYEVKFPDDAEMRKAIAQSLFVAPAPKAAETSPLRIAWKDFWLQAEKMLRLPVPARPVESDSDYKNRFALYQKQMKFISPWHNTWRLLEKDVPYEAPKESVDIPLLIGLFVRFPGAPAIQEWIKSVEYYLDQEQWFAEARAGGTFARLNELEFAAPKPCNELIALYVMAKTPREFTLRVLKPFLHSNRTRLSEIPYFLKWYERFLPTGEETPDEE